MLKNVPTHQTCALTGTEHVALYVLQRHAGHRGGLDDEPEEIVMERSTPYTVHVGDDKISVRVMLIAQGTFEAVGRYNEFDFIIRGKSIEDALERFQRTVQNRHSLR